MNVGTIINQVQQAIQVYVNTRNTDPTAREQLLHLQNELLAQIDDIGALIQDLFFFNLSIIKIVYQQKKWHFL